MDPHLLLPVSDASHASEARRVVTTLAVSLGFDAADAARLGLVVTEAATNIVKHAGRGRLLARALSEAADQPGIELLALDQGPGMADVERCRRDGYSTAGSPGTGLGAIARLSSSFEIYAAPGAGTALLIRILPRGAKLPGDTRPLRVGGVRVPAPGETECGDDWSFAPAGSRALLMVVDGLGHGPDAALAAAAAVRVFRSSLELPAGRIVEAAQRVLVSTRGAAVSVAELALEQQQVHYSAIGNISGAIVWPGGSRNLVGQNGTAGGPFRQARTFSYPWHPGGALVMYSDGLTHQVSLERYPGLLARHPSLIAGVLYRDFNRGRDDATIVVAQEPKAAP